MVIKNMLYSFKTKGHKNVTSKHRSTIELTQETDIRLAADCIIGVLSPVSLSDLPLTMRKKIQDEETQIRLILETENAWDQITGYGHPDLTLDHPTDMVCRKSRYKCSRTLMIKADKAAIDLKRELVEDLKQGKELKVTIIVE